MTELLFYFLCGLTLFPALAVVLSNNLFHAGLSLIVSFLGVAAIYATLSAPFVAGIQVLVYAGAIAVILLFAFMLTHDIGKPLEASTRIQQSSSAVACLLLLGLIGRVLQSSGWSQSTAPSSPDPGVTMVALGEAFLTKYLVPFELVSILLLMTLVGAIVVARKEEQEGPGHISARPSGFDQEAELAE